MVTLACVKCAPLVLAGYQFYSYIPNSVSTIAGGLWIGQGVINGENNLSIIQTSQETVVSISVSQDSIAAVISKVIGWDLHEPNAASFFDAGVLGYDYGRSGIGDLIPPFIPTWINPTLSFSTLNGFNFSWNW